MAQSFFRYGKALGKFSFVLGTSLHSLRCPCFLLSWKVCHLSVWGGELSHFSFHFLDCTYKYKNNLVASSAACHKVKEFRGQRVPPVRKQEHCNYIWPMDLQAASLGFYVRNSCTIKNNLKFYLALECTLGFCQIYLSYNLRAKQQIKATVRFSPDKWSMFVDGTKDPKATGSTIGLIAKWMKCISTERTHWKNC